MVERHTIPVTILVCDPDAASRLAARRMFERARVGNEVRFVDNGEQFLDYLYQRNAFGGELGLAPRPGLILFDLLVPRIGGRDALTVMKDDPSLADIPVIALSSVAADNTSARCEALGVDAIIVTPLTFAGLAAAIDHLDRHWYKIVEAPRASRPSPDGPA